MHAAYLAIYLADLHSAHLCNCRSVLLVAGYTGKTFSYFISVPLLKQNGNQLLVFTYSY